MSSKQTRKIIIISLVVLIGIQFIRPSRRTPRVDPNSGFIALTATPPEMAKLIKTACYDCHSYETKYPWYANVAPVSWWMSNNIHEARKHLNFSEWGMYPNKKRVHKLEEAGEEVSEGNMPIPNYTWLHANARLTDEQRKSLVAYFQEMKNATGSIPTMPSSNPNTPQ